MTGKPKRSRAAARRAARLAAVQALYQIELGGASAETVISEFLQTRLNGPEVDPVYVGADQALFEAVVRGVTERGEDVDRMVQDMLASGWSLERVEAVLRAILRAGAWELLARKDVPPRVAINEYVEIAHSFFAGGEPGFVNGALDRLARVLRAEEMQADSAS